MLNCDDFLQNFSLKLYLWHADSLEDGKEFLLAGDKEKLQPKAEEEPKEAEKPKDDTNGTTSDMAIEGDDEQITEEKSAEQVTAEELKAKKAAAEAVDDG